MKHWFIIQNDCMLLAKKDNSLLKDSDIEGLSSQFLRSFKLEKLNNIEYYCAEIDQDRFVPDGIQCLPRRQALLLFSGDEYGMAVRAYSVLSWDRNHQFCGRCGELTVHQLGTFERVCSACKLSFFPRISPSIIVLIKKGESILMARGPHFAQGIYGLIAGFVELGESLGEAVHREVREEVGLKVKNLTYFGSQPWPFPDSLMMAFTADYASGEIVIDNGEIREAAWYKYNELPGRPSMAISIASKLIDEFIDSFEKK